MMRTGLLAAAVFLLLQGLAFGQVPVDVAPVALDPADPGHTRTGRLEYRGGLAIASTDERFGGLSALELAEDGARLLALSDSAWWVTASLAWDGEANRLVGLSDLSIAPVRDADGHHFRGRAGDSEGLAPLGGGRYAVSFERQHRVLAYDLGEDWSAVDTALPEPVALPAVLDDLPDNRGLESLVGLPDGHLLLGVEYPTDISLGHALWAGSAGGWVRHTLQSRPSFGLTGMARHGDTVYAVERFWSRSTGNRIGILGFARPGDAATSIAPETLGRIDPPLTVDNFEGIAVTERGGETLLLILSDDNYSNRQRTLLMAFAVVE